MEDTYFDPKCFKLKQYPFWKPVLPAELKDQVKSYVHTSLGYLGPEKCMCQISHTFHVKNIGRKLRRLKHDVGFKLWHPRCVLITVYKE